MIYLLQDCYKNDKGEYIDILKIGYSEKPFMESRNNQYKTHNYGYRFIGERDGSTELESYIHRKFKSFLLPNSKEWFYYNQELVDDFYTIQFTDEIEEIDKTVLVDWLREDLIETIPNPNNLYEKYSKELEEELSQFTEDKDEIIEGLRIFKKELHKNCKEIKENILSINLFEDPFIKSLPDHLNISLDLPQIIGRQRLKENVFRNEVLILYKAETKKGAIINESKLVNDEKVKLKEDETNKLLEEYDRMTEEGKLLWAKVAKRDSELYKNNYLGVSSRTGKATFNYLVKVADQRAYDVSRREYIDDITIKTGIEGIESSNVEIIDDIDNYLQDSYREFISEFSKDNNFERRMKLLCDIYFQFPEFYNKYGLSIQVAVPIEYQNYINLLGFERIRALGYRENDIIELIESQNNLRSNPITSLFTIGSKYSKAQIKEMLREFYTNNNISKTPKASDLEEYYNLKSCQFMENGKKVNGFLIISKKGD